MRTMRLAVAAILVVAAITVLLLLVGNALASPSPEGAPVSDRAVELNQPDAAWSSGWVDIAAGTVLTFTHNLGGSPGDYAVELWFRDTAPGGLGINQRGAGGLEANDRYYGAYWQNLTSNTIQVVRLRDDIFADQVYVQVWIPDPPDWESGWVDIAAGTLVTLTHNLGGNRNSYTVGLWFRDTTPGGSGMNIAGYGGLEMAGQIRGAGWQDLTNTTISIRRYPDDVWADQVRVRIFIPDPPDWDSGWVDIAAGTVVTLTHDLGGNLTHYVIRDWHRDTALDGIGINQQFFGGYEAGGTFFGANWQDLTGTDISCFRFADDWVADQVRIRIWVPAVPSTATPTGTTIPGTPTSTSTRTPTASATRTATRTLTATPTGVLTSCVPSLISPAPGALMDNGRQDYLDSVTWDFDWSDCPGATAYHLYVIGAAATIPTIDNSMLTSSSYHHVAITFIADVNRLNWTWKVRAKVNGQWGEWSETRLFDIEPVNTDPPSITPTATATRTATFTPTGTPGQSFKIYLPIVLKSSPAGPALTATAILTGTPMATRTATRTPTRTPTATRTATRTPTRTVTAGPPSPTPSGHWEGWTNGNYVRDLALPSGILWAGSEGGAVRWNPPTSNYTKYLASDGLRDGYVKAVVPADSGAIWFGTWGGGLVAYDGLAWTAFNTTHGLVSNFVQGIALQGSVKWVGTDYGFNAFDDNGTLTNTSDDLWTTFRTPDGLSSSNVRAVALDASGRKWLATSAGLSLLDDGGTPHDKANDTWVSFKKTDGLVDDSVYAVAVDAQNRVWAGTLSGLSVLDLAGTPGVKTDDTWTTFGPADGLADDDVYDLALDSQGRVWIATYGGGIFVLDHGGTPTVKTDDTWTQFSTADGLAHNNVYALTLDELAKQVWIGTWGYGISRLSYAGTVANKSDDTWTTFVTTDPLPSNYVYALLSDSDVAWVGTDSGLVATNGQTWTTFTTADGLVSNYTYAFAPQDGIKWIGTSSGVAVFDDGGTPHDKANDQWASFRVADGLSSEYVYDLDVDSAGRLWAASTPWWTGGVYVGGGLSLLDDGGTPFDKADDQWMPYLPADTNGLFNGWGYEIALDGTHRVWIGGYPLWDGSKYVGGGLFLLDHAGTPFDKADDTWTVFTTTHGLPDNFVYAVAVDSGGRVWSGTFNGLSVLDYHGTPFDKADDTWTQFSTADGLAHPSVYAIVFDPAGRLWLATGDGLSMLDTRGSPHNKADDVWVTWRTANGLVDNGLTSVAIGSSGAVWVGASAGLGRMSGAVLP